MQLHQAATSSDAAARKQSRGGYVHEHGGKTKPASQSGDAARVDALGARVSLVVRVPRAASERPEFTVLVDAKTRQGRPVPSTVNTIHCDAVKNCDKNPASALRLSPP